MEGQGCRTTGCPLPEHSSGPAEGLASSSGSWAGRRLPVLQWEKEALSLGGAPDLGEINTTAITSVEGRAIWWLPVNTSAAFQSLADPCPSWLCLTH